MCKNFSIFVIKKYNNFFFYKKNDKLLNNIYICMSMYLLIYLIFYEKRIKVFIGYGKYLFSFVKFNL